MKKRRFVQCDVFTDTPTKGNGLAVVVDAEGLSDEQMQSFAAWTNLAETTFLFPAANPKADYRVRIFTPKREMPFAGHPTLGSCAAWLKYGGKPSDPAKVIQECAIGPVAVHLQGNDFAFEAPPTKITEMPEKMKQAIISAAGLDPSRVVATAVLDNGPVWQAVRLKSAEDVLAIDSSKIRWPEFQGIGMIGPHDVSGDQEGKLDLGLIAPHAKGGRAKDGAFDFEVRMLAPSSGMSEDPITGSLNAALAKWMLATGDLPPSMTVSQGVCLGRSGKVMVSRQDSGGVLIGGAVQMMIEGELTL